MRVDERAAGEKKKLNPREFPDDAGLGILPPSTSLLEVAVTTCCTCRQLRKERAKQASNKQQPAKQARSKPTKLLHTAYSSFRRYCCCCYFHPLLPLPHHTFPPLPHLHCTAHSLLPFCTKSPPHQRPLITHPPSQYPTTSTFLQRLHGFANPHLLLLLHHHHPSTPLDKC